MSERLARALLATLVAGLLVVSARIDLPSLSGHRFWSDTATYYTATWSLVEDRDLRFEARDLLRVRRQYGGASPEGIFLKRAFGGLAWSGEFPWLRRIGQDEPRVYFAKAFVHPVFAAPFVALLGNRGFMVLNAAALGLCLLLGYAELRRRTTPARALGVACALFLGTITPLYLLWPMPELLNVALLAGGLTAWRRERPLLAAVLFGIATYSKPPNVLVALPLGVAPLLVARGTLVGLLESLRRGVVLCAAAGLLYGLNLAVTGEWNYQGGRERKTFHGRMPFDEHGNTFGNSGTWMTTNQVGPIVEGRNEDLVTRQTGPARAPGEIRDSFLWNLVYFWVGRFGGALPYFAPVVVALVLFVLLGPRERAGWLGLAGLLVSYLAYIWVIPDNWYGGGGTLGNRYFLNLVPLALLFVPRGREWWVVAGGVAGLALFVGPILAAPMTHTLNPGRHATRAVFRAFPLELTMLNDLAIFTELWRKKQSVGDTEGDPHRPGSADTSAYYLYFPDDGTCLDGAPAGSAHCGRHEQEGRVGFRIAHGRSAQVVLRALEPVRVLHFRLEAGDVGDEIEVRVPGGRARRLLSAGETAEFAIEPDAGFGYYDTFLYVLGLRSLRPASPTGEPSFVSIALEVDERPRLAN